MTYIWNHNKLNILNRVVYMNYIAPDSDPFLGLGYSSLCWTCSSGLLSLSLQIWGHVLDSLKNEDRRPRGMAAWGPGGAWYGGCIPSVYIYMHNLLYTQLCTLTTEHAPHIVEHQCFCWPEQLLKQQTYFSKQQQQQYQKVLAQLIVAGLFSTFS